MKPVIEVENISKKFRINHAQEPYLSIRDSFKNIFKRTTREDFYALKNISFKVYEGDSVGIIGRNGAGKSTLLKILSKITPPTSGNITYKGRIASLLEVGTGFHSELTGRENVFMNGSILGMKRAEIRKNFDAIVDFAGVEKFIDTPLKHYSSGMQLRLAFAVAAFLENEILIIDEVLAVGDTEFQKKCIGKMDEVSRGGRTLLFVSHDLQVISTLTRSGILLNEGEVVMTGTSSEVIESYMNLAVANNSTFECEVSGNQPQIIKVVVNTSSPNGVHKQGDKLVVDFWINMPEEQNNMALSFQIFNTKNQAIVYSWLFDKDKSFARTKGKHKVSCVMENCKLYKGHYYIKAHLAETKRKVYYGNIDNICHFSVEMFDKDIEWGWQDGVCTYLEDVNWIVN